jgi:elongation factor 1-beta
LFGDEDEAEASAPKASMADKVKQIKEEKAKAKKVDRSQVLFEVKPVDTDTGTYVRVLGCAMDKLWHRSQT